MTEKFYIDPREINITSVKYLLCHQNVHVNTIFNICSFRKSQTTLLRVAIENEDKELIDYLINEGADVNLNPLGDDTLLFLAAKQGNFTIVQKLHQLGAIIDHQRPIQKHTPLSIAIWNQHYQIADYLIRNGADVNAKIYSSMSSRWWSCVLHLAAIKAPKNIVELLLDHNADINKATETGMTALKFAHYNQNMDVFKLLIDRGANFVQYRHRSSEDFSLYNDAYNHLITCNEHTMNINSIINNNRGLLFYVISKNGNNVQFIQLLLDAGIDINMVNSENRLAIERDYSSHRYSANCSIIELHIVKLISAGFDVCERNRQHVKKQLNIFGPNCRTELQTIEITNVGSSNINFFEVLLSDSSKNSHYLAVRLKNAGLDRVIDKEQLCKDYPLYGGMLFYKLCVINYRIELIKKVENSIENELCSLGLPFDFVRELWWYFSNDELGKCCSMSKYLKIVQ